MATVVAANKISRANTGGPRATVNNGSVPVINARSVFFKVFTLPICKCFATHAIAMAISARPSSSSWKRGHAGHQGSSFMTCSGGLSAELERHSSDIIYSKSARQAAYKCLIARTARCASSVVNTKGGFRIGSCWLEFDSHWRKARVIKRGYGTVAARHRRSGIQAKRPQRQPRSHRPGAFERDFCSGRVFECTDSSTRRRDQERNPFPQRSSRPSHSWAQKLC